jgi:hypothetical protein
MDSTIGWSSLMRVDMLALFLMYTGLGIYICLGRRERWQYVAAVLFVLAVLTKETALSAPLACATFGLLVDWRGTIRVGASAGFLLAAIMAGFNAATHGGFFTHILEYNQNPFSWAVAARHIYPHARTSWPWLVGGAAAFAAIWNPAAIPRLGWKRFFETRAASRYGRGVLLSGLNAAYAAPMLASSGKLGANYNHFLAWDIAICLLCGLFVYRMIATARLRQGRGRAAAWVCGLLLCGLFLPPVNLLGSIAPGIVASNPALWEDEVLETVRQTSGPVFSENLLLLIQAEKPVTAEPATLTYLSLAGRWNEQPYVSLFEQRYFSLLVTYDIHSERYTPAVASAIEAAYTLRRRIGAYSLYYPSGPGDVR